MYIIFNLSNNVCLMSRFIYKCFVWHIINVELRHVSSKFVFKIAALITHFVYTL